VVVIYAIFKNCGTEGYRKEEVKKELFLLTTSLNFCGVKKIIEDHRL